MERKRSTVWSLLSRGIKTGTKRNSFLVKITINLMEAVTQENSKINRLSFGHYYTTHAFPDPFPKVFSPNLPSPLS